MYHERTTKILLGDAEVVGTMPPAYAASDLRLHICQTSPRFDVRSRRMWVGAAVERGHAALDGCSQLSPRNDQLCFMKFSDLSDAYEGGDELECHTMCIIRDGWSSPS